MREFVIHVAGPDLGGARITLFGAGIIPTGTTYHEAGPERTVAVGALVMRIPAPNADTAVELVQSLLPDYDVTLVG